MDEEYRLQCLRHSQSEVHHDHGCAHRYLYQRCGSRPCLLSRRTQTSFSRCRPRLANLRHASTRSRVSRFGEERSARALLHVRRHRRNLERTPIKASKGLRGKRTTLGKSRQVRTPRRREDRHLPAKTSEPVESQPLNSAAKRRKNAAHGASRGYRAATSKP